MIQPSCGWWSNRTPNTMIEEQLSDEAPPPRRRAPGGGRKRLGDGVRQKCHITLNPRLAELVQWHANARGNSLSESINILLGEALRNHEVDVEAQEVH